MSEFKQQVAEALGGISWKPRNPAFGGDATVAALADETIEHLAPRVAAAIEAAAKSSWNQAIKTRGCVSEDVVDQAWHTASLFALRGEP